MALNTALEEVLAVVSAINRYLEQTAPWSLAKKGDTNRVATILYNAAEALRLTSLLLQPVMPQKAIELWQRLGWQPPQHLHEGLAWGLLVEGTAVVAGKPLFPREV
jgi:methionyl-tRNA synthetase